MRNPYAHSGTGEGAPDPSLASAIDPRLGDYDAAVGPNADYYRPRFEHYDATGAHIGWHWPAFFVTSAWFIYRKMYAIGIINLVYPFVLWIGTSIAVALTQDPRWVLTFLLFPLIWVVLPVLANRLYWRRIRRIIESTPAGGMSPDPARRAAVLQQQGGVAVGPTIAAVVVMLLLWVGVIGVLAAISIPAYQDYIIRSQVVEGLVLSGPLKAEVAEYVARNKDFPLDLEQLGPHQPVTGKYVSSVTVERGSLVIMYGRQANRVLDGRMLILVPGLSESGDVVWACGNRHPADISNWGPGPTGTDVHPKYLPITCRSQSR